MLRKLKQQVTSAVNATVNGEPRHEVLVNDTSFGNPNADISASAEGFLCPICMVRFPSPDDLQQHFPTHSPSRALEPQTLSPSVSASSYFDDLAEPTRIANLMAQLRDEKRYSSEIKKELDRLQSVVAASTDVPEGEVPYLLQQIQALEAGKSMLTQRLLEVERDLAGAKRDKNDVIARLAELSSTMKNLQETNEEAVSMKEISQEDIRRYQGLVDVLERDKRELEAQLAQRPSEDDVHVLGTELVRVQRLLDHITEQKEEEIQEHLQTIENLKTEQSDHQALIDELREQVSNAAPEDQLAELRSRNEKLSQECSSRDAEISALQRKVGASAEIQKETANEVQRLTTALEESLQKLNNAKASSAEADGKSKASEEEVAKLKSDLDQKVYSYEKQIESLSGDCESLQSELLREKKASVEALAKQEALKDEMEEKLKGLARSLGEERANAEKQKEELFAKEKELDEIKRTVGSLEDSAKELESTKEKLRLKIAQLEKNAAELQEKIKEGEGGADLAFAQLNEEKTKLSSEISKLTEELRSQKASYEMRLVDINDAVRDLENKRRVLNEKLKASSQKEGTLEGELVKKVAAIEELSKAASSSKSEYDSKLHEKEQQVKDAQKESKKVSKELESLRKKFRELEVESSKKSQRMIEVENAAEEELTEMKKKCDVAVAALEESRKTIVQLTEAAEADKAIIAKMDSQMVEERERISSAVEKLEAAELKARQLEKQLSEKARTEESLSTELQSTLEDLHTLKEEVSQKNATIAQLTTKIGEVEREVSSCNEHLKAKTADFEQQIERNHEHNEELISKINVIEARSSELQKALEERRNELRHKEEIIDDLQKHAAELQADVVRCDELTAKLADAKKSLEAMEAENKAIEDNLHEVTESLASLQSQYTELTSQVKVAYSEKEFLITTLHDKEKFAETQLKDRERQISELAAELKSRKEDGDVLREQIKELEDCKEQCEKEIAGYTKSLQQTELSLSEKNSEMDSLNVVNITINEELENLREELNSLRTAKEEQSQRCVQLESELEAARKKEEQLKETQKCLREEIATLKAEMETQKISFDAFKRESERVAEEKEAKMKATVTEQKSLIEELTFKVNETEREMDEKREDVRRMEAEQQKIRENNGEMERKLKTFGEERKGLMERCLRVESDLDFERDRAMENKRRFDDALSAMHELGRANQSLQIDMSKQFNRKWLDDSEAVNCFHCGKQFSLTVRKHHCRICGQIFCSPCSSQTAKVASSKNPVRVCINCHGELAGH
ncbi:hypothetical protein QR680_005589 [Steinernema hermaphroditum]|uniref:FYVE-type domain-containing protein n=1 Tax=Steinernema hermaphroditum TaxID=289476 RepID=A0AA39HTN5_9BILA|nr:hypothetical protein QR680_005589 [Steinernema hermaphroditum]